MKLIYLVGALALTLTFGCDSQPAEEQTKVIEKETVKVVEVDAPAEKVVVEKAPVEEEKGTTIKIDREGGSIETKKVDIKIEN